MTLSSNAWHGRPDPVGHLVGRARERSMLQQSLSDAVHGHGGLVLIGGEAGIGKTSLAEEVLRQARAGGARTFTGGCYDLTTTPPYGPWLEVVQSMRELDDLPAPPPALDDASTLTDVGSQTVLFDAVRTFLVSMAAEKPLVVLLEDLHWADHASLDLLRYLARHLRDQQQLLIATYREDELTRRHPLSVLLPRMTREAQATRLHLRPLGDRAIRDLVTERYRLPASDTQRLVTHLAENSEGNPFFVQTLLTSLEDEGILTSDGATWRLDALPTSHLPPLVQEVVEARLAVLPDDVREVLEGAAVLGHEVPLDLWQRVSGLSTERLVAVVEQASMAHVLEDGNRPDQLRFTHALVREVLVDGITPLQRRVWHRKVAETLLATERPDPDDVAYHLHQAGDEREADWLIRAGLRAERAYANKTGTDRYEAASRFLEASPTRQRQRGWLQFRIGCVRRFSHPREALEYFSRARRAGEDVGDQVLDAFASYGEGLVRFSLGETERGAKEWREGIEKTEALPVTDRVRMFNVNEATRNFSPDAMPDVFDLGSESSGTGSSASRTNEVLKHDVTARAALAGQLVAVGRIAEAWELIEPLDGLDKRWQTSALFNNRGFLKSFLGQPEEAWEDLKKAWLDPQIEPILRIRMVGAQLLGFIHPYGADNLDERTTLRKIIAEIPDSVTESLPPSWSPSLFLLPLDVLEGRWREACEVADTVDWDAGRRHEAQWLRVPLAEIAAYQGDRSAFLDHLQAVLPDGPTTNPGAISILPALLLQRLSAGLAIDDGDLPRSRDWLEAHDRWLDWSGMVLGRADGLLCWAKFHLAANSVPTSRRLAKEALAAATNPRQPLVLVAAHRLLSQLDLDGGRQQDAERHLRDSLVLAEACAAPFERALTLLEFAQLHLTTGQTDQAQAVLAEVRTVAESLDARPTLARVTALENQISVAPPVYPAGLTTREVDVLRLVATGMSDVEVAEELSISPRTVSSHLTSIYTKLEVNSRTAAAMAARDLSLV